MAFRVGQKVVCVNAGNGFATGRPVPLVKGRIYVIADISDIGEGGVNVGGYEYYRPNRFRPLVTRKTDISALKALLEPVRERV